MAEFVIYYVNSIAYFGVDCQLGLEKFSSTVGLCPNILYIEIAESNQMVTLGGVLSIQQILHNKQIITVPFRDEPIVIMTSKEVADVARHGSDIESLAPPKNPSLKTWIFYYSL